MVGPALRLKHIIRRPGLLRLQQLLQRRLVVAQGDSQIQRVA